MKWYFPVKQAEPLPGLGQTDCRVRFAWFPVRLNDREILWLESYADVYEYSQFAGDGDYFPGDGWLRIGRMRPWEVTPFLMKHKPREFIP